MRKKKIIADRSNISIFALDDDPVMTLAIQSYFRNTGYNVDVETDPDRAIERIQNGKYDILILDFLMMPLRGDQVVEEIRKFNKELFIVLLTGHKSLAPPLETIRKLDIQGYYEKSDRFDQLELLIESCVKAIYQMRTVKSYQAGLSGMLEFMPELYNQYTTDALADKLIQTGEGLFAGSRFGVCLFPEGSGGEPEICGKLDWLDKDSARELTKFTEPDDEDTNRLTEILRDEKEQCIGLLCAGFRQKPAFEQKQLFSLYARQSAGALVNASLHSELADKNLELIDTYSQLNSSYIEMIRVIRLMVDAKDIYTRGHSDRVAYFAARIAETMGKSKEYIDNIRIAGLFHDIGKVAVPDMILLKPASLTTDEYNALKDHPSRGARIMSAISVFQDISMIIEQHHERIDGSGYPYGLRGDEICEEARIITVADAFDAMTSDRRYRSAYTYKQATEQLLNGKGHQFDEKIVDVYVNEILCDETKIKYDFTKIADLI